MDRTFGANLHTFTNATSGTMARSGENQSLEIAAVDAQSYTVQAAHNGGHLEKQPSSTSLQPGVKRAELLLKSWT